VVLSSAAAVKEMTRPSTDASFSNRPKGLFAAIFSDNYQTLAHAPHGPYWRQLRTFSSTELFSPLRHASYQDAREQELRNMLTVLEQQADKGRAINMKSWLFELSANVMTRMLINKRFANSGLSLTYLFMNWITGLRALSFASLLKFLQKLLLQNG
jgi:hypothetical protein